MKAVYHRQITQEALQGKFEPGRLAVVISANLHQDRPAGQIGHPYFHFDDNDFEAGYRYLDTQRSIILDALCKGASGTQACEAFGRLTHAAQDFYAHSNYVALWLARAPEAARGDPQQIDPADERVMNSPDLLSGNIYLPWVLFTYLPVLGNAVKALIPRNSHTWMNLDDPQQGHLFPYAFAAAKIRTGLEFKKIAGQIQEQVGAEALSRFTGLDAG